MCTYELPFNGGSQVASIYQIVNKVQEPIKNPYSEDLKGLITQLLLKDPVRRPSMHDII
jgi:hypothetical protein